MSTYELQIHARYLNLPLVPPQTGIARHTGYDLIERDNNGIIVQITSLDLSLDNGKIIFHKHTVTNEASINSNMVLPDEIIFDDENNPVNVDDQLVEDYDFMTTSVVTGNIAKTYFDWICFDAKFREASGQDVDVGGIDYDVEGPNCNTWTNYVGYTYCSVSDVISQFSSRYFPGKNNSFNNGNQTDDNIKCQILEQFMTSFRNALANKSYDIANATIEVSGSSYSNWHCIIKNCTIDNQICTYVYDVDTGNSTISTETNQDSFVYAGGGQNHVTTGSGSDTINCGDDYDLVNAGFGSDIINTYGGDDDVDTKIGGENGITNYVYLGSGSDTFTGGAGIDIVDGGSGAYGRNENGNILTSGVSTIVTDTGDDTNAISLGGGNDQYTGGIGVDKVKSGSGNDTISTGAGNDEVDTTESNKEDINIVNLGAGSDKFIGGAGIDIVDGGTGSYGMDKDGYAYISGSSIALTDVAGNTNNISLGGGDDIYYGAVGADIVDGGMGDDEIRTAGGNDTIRAGTGADYIEPGTGNNVNGESFGDAWNKGYTEYRDFARQELQDGYQRNSTISAGAEIAGAAISPITPFKAKGFTGSLGKVISHPEDIARTRWFNTIGTGIVNGAGYTDENTPREYSRNIATGIGTNALGTASGNKLFGSYNDMYRFGRGAMNAGTLLAPYIYNYIEDWVNKK